jgi:aminopeptidase N
MTLYTMQSLAPALTAASDFFFEITKLSLEFYEATLGIDYAYKKYDYAFVPHMSDDAM